MGRDILDIVTNLPKDRHDRIKAEAERIVQESMTLGELRKARAVTQIQLAERLGMGQEGVSRLEKRSDALLSTLRNAVASLGGELNLVVKFQDRPQVILTGFGETEAKPVRRTAARKPPVAKRVKTG